MEGKNPEVEFIATGALESIQRAEIPLPLVY